MQEVPDRIVIDPSVRSGQPIVRGTRITVSDVLEYLAGGMSPEEVVDDFPDLTIEDIRKTKHLDSTWHFNDGAVYYFTTQPPQEVEMH